jgi:hypothetical protein
MRGDVTRLVNAMQFAGGYEFSMASLRAVTLGFFTVLSASGRIHHKLSVFSEVGPFPNAMSAKKRAWQVFANALFTFFSPYLLVPTRRFELLTPRV